jgi:diguanylate cyclase (GGDEF)-like protein
LSVLFVDSDPAFLHESCRLVAEDGYRAWGAEDLLAAANFLADHNPHLLVVELELLETDGADPLSDLRARAPAAPVVLTAPGPPDDRFRTFRETHEIFGYHDKRHGADALRLWVTAALTSARQIDTIRETRRRLRRVVEAVPDLHRIQTLDELMETILARVNELVRSEGAFVAARARDPVGVPPIEGFTLLADGADDYVVGASTAGRYPTGVTVDEVRSVPGHLVTRALEERMSVMDDEHGVLPLALAEHVLGLAYLRRPDLRDRDVELLQLFAAQAAAAIRNAALYELATIDATTRVFQKAFTLDRLRETLKLAWRKAFPVSVIMIDLDSFKELNDEYGHIAGDRALRHIGRLLRSCVRDSDIVGRFGGDEFLVILVDADAAGTEIVASRLLQNLFSDQALPRPPGVPPLNATMGMATLAADGDGGGPSRPGLPDFPRAVESLVAAADAAMYQARREQKLTCAATPLDWSSFVRVA